MYPIVHQVQTTHAECFIVIHLLEKEEECKLKKKTTNVVFPATAHNKTAGGVASGSFLASQTFEASS